MSINYIWQPIEALSATDRAIDLSLISSLMASWKLSTKTWKQDNLEEFKKRLIRRFSVQTGIIEGLYDLDVGATETLVAQGFVDSFLRHSDSTLEPASLIRVLKDHEAAIGYVMDGIAGQRVMSKAFIHELHDLLLRHQSTTEGIDQFGRRVDITLRKGQYKLYPNNPTRSDGLLHEYCPPLQVESEMERLLEFVVTYAGENPILLAAFLHHRFTQIHPYQDGNGRLARTLMNYVLLKAQLLPIVIQGQSEQRIQYIDALERADRGYLKPLVMLFARLQQEAILQALSFEISSQSSTAVVIEAFRAKLLYQNQNQDQLRRVNAVALAARVIAQNHLEIELQKLKVLPQINSSQTIGGSDLDTGHWYKHQVSQIARATNTFVRFSENTYFLKVKIWVGKEQMSFVIFWHHIGQELSGVMQTVSFAELESSETELQKTFINTSIEPFVFTHTMDATSINGQYLEWLDAAFAVALKALLERL